VEHRAPWAMDAFHRSLELLRTAGVRIAVDDLGIGASNFRMIVDCRPDHLKIDRYIVNGCASDPIRMAVLDSIVSLARSIGASPIAEGVEAQADLDAIHAAGVTIIQGWIFAPAMRPEVLMQSAYLEDTAVRRQRMH